MKDRTLNKLTFTLAFLIVVLLMLLASPLWADDDHHCQGNSCNGSDGGDVIVNTDLIGGDTSTVLSTSNKSFAFAHSLGDVDINEGANCMGSEQWGTFVVSKQKLALNQWCAALFYDLNGMAGMAAMMRCDIKDIRQHFATDQECWDANTVNRVALTPPEPVIIYQDNDEDDERIAFLEVQIAQLTQGYEQQQQAPPQVIERTVVEQRPLLSEEVADSLRYKK